MISTQSDLDMQTESYGVTQQSFKKKLSRVWD